MTTKALKSPLLWFGFALFIAGVALLFSVDWRIGVGVLAVQSSENIARAYREAKTWEGFDWGKGNG